VTVNGVPSGPVTVTARMACRSRRAPCDGASRPGWRLRLIPRLSRLEGDRGVMVTVQGGPVEQAQTNRCRPERLPRLPLPVLPPEGVLPPTGGTEPDEPRVPVPADVVPPGCRTPPIGAARQHPHHPARCRCRQRWASPTPGRPPELFPSRRQSYMSGIPPAARRATGGDRPAHAIRRAGAVVPPLPLSRWSQSCRQRQQSSRRN